MAIQNLKGNYKKYPLGCRFRPKKSIGENELRELGYSRREVMRSVLCLKTLKRVEPDISYEPYLSYFWFYFEYNNKKLKGFLTEDMIEITDENEPIRNHKLTSIFMDKPINLKSKSPPDPAEEKETQELMIDEEPITW